ncbi:MAG: hypothetical protein V3V67_18005 [Myxococcota bacterium]
MSSTIASPPRFATQNTKGSFMVVTGSPLSLSAALGPFGMD